MDKGKPVSCPKSRPVRILSLLQDTFWILRQNSLQDILKMVAMVCSSYLPHYQLNLLMHNLNMRVVWH